MSDLTITKAGVEHQEELIAFGKQEFSRTFGHLYTPEDLEAYLNDGYAAEKYATWLSDDNYRIFVAHKTDGSIGGYVLCGPNSMPLQNCGLSDEETSKSWEVKRLYIHPDHFGSKLGSQLLDCGLSWLREIGQAERVYLGVYSENLRALKFYNRHGFEKVGEYGFTVGDSVDREFICHWKQH